jgi:hypothetical protein
MVERVRYDRLGSVTSVIIVVSTAPCDGGGETERGDFTAPR